MTESALDTREVSILRQQESTMSVLQVRHQMEQVRELMSAEMQNGEDFGVVPGTKKPTLLKPGAEKLCLMFRLAPDPESVDTFDKDHLTVKAKCTLYHIPTGMKVGAGEGSCSTKESKYAFRDANRICPTCGVEAIIKGKEEFGGGWLCFKKKGGCGGKWSDGAAEIENQKTGKVPNEALPDLYNTVLKMANKRALVAAVLNVTAASAIFTQDIEDQPEPQRATETVPKNQTEQPQPETPPAADMGQSGRLSFIPKDVKASTRMDGKKQVFDYALIWTPAGIPIETKSIVDTNIAMEARRDSQEITIDYVKGPNGLQVKHLIAINKGDAQHEV